WYRNIGASKIAHRGSCRPIACRSRHSPIRRAPRRPLFRTFFPEIAGAGGCYLVEGWLRARGEPGNIADEQNEVGSVVVSISRSDLVDTGRAVGEAGPYLGTAPYQIIQAVVAGRPGPGDKVFVESRRSRPCGHRQSDQTFEEIFAKDVGSD